MDKELFKILLIKKFLLYLHFKINFNKNQFIMKRMFFLFAFLFAIVAMEANVVPIDNDVGPPITMELNATANVAVAQNVNFLFAEAQHIDKVFKIDTEYTLCETYLSNSIAAEATYNDIFIKAYQLKKNKRKDRNSNYYIPDLRLTMLDVFNILDQNNTYYRSYLRQVTQA